ncbi:MAG: hypothetical protein QOG03_182 [Actinomycetota bacterium]|jgi:hypothetical protein|nr:hypothetical protein [Actinomycetota bacterium]
MGRRAVVMAMALVVVVCAVYLRAPGRGQEQFVDEVVNRQTVDRMRAGEGYYRAMRDSLQANTSLPDSPRAFREPTMFVVWRLLPSAESRWVAFVLLALAAGVLTAATASTPLAGPAVALYLLHAARPRDGGLWIDQNFLTELWSGALVVIALSAWRRGLARITVIMSMVAVAVRELAFPLLIGGLLASRVRRRRAVWLVAIMATIAGTGLHFVLAAQQTSSSGSQAMLLGTGGPDRLLDLAGVGFPHRTLAGAVLLALGWWRVSRDGALLRFIGPILALPLIGLAVGRDYWGFVVVPVLVVLAVEAVAAVSSPSPAHA